MSAETFEELARLPDDQIDVARGALLVARDVYDNLEIDYLLSELDLLGEGCQDYEAMSEDRLPSLRDRVQRVNLSFRARGFRGNSEDYYDPRNSLLNDVMQRGLGIPITLSIIWVAMARGASLLARGVAFPGHFLVRVDGPRTRAGKPIIVDPFQGGRIIDEQAATVLLKRTLGDGAELNASLFEPANPRATLVRLITNLQATYVRRGELTRAFLAADRIVTLVPDSPRMLRERGELALRIGAPEVARADFSRVLSLEPQAPDAAQIESRLAKLEGPSKITLH